MKISIIVPIYNSSNYLNKCVDSLIDQTYRDIEIILVNDGSTDDSLEICNYYKSNDNRIVIINKKNGGLSDARNVGLDISSGNYVLFVDSDDYIELNTCEKFVDVIKDNKVDILSGNARRIDGNNIMLINHSLAITDKLVTGNEFLKNELQNNSMNMAAWLNIYNTNFLKSNKLYYKKGIFHEDELFTPQAFLKAQNVMSINITFYNYIIRKNSITTKANQIKNAKDILYICKTLEKIYLNLENDKLKKYLNNHIVNLYLNIFQVARLYKKKYKYLVDRNLLKNKGYTRLNKIRVKLFCISPKLYYFINFVRKQFIIS